jgi:hypothetical protein
MDDLIKADEKLSKLTDKDVRIVNLHLRHYGFTHRIQ